MLYYKTRYTNLGVLQHWLCILMLSILKFETWEALPQDSNHCAVGYSVFVGNKVSLSLGLGSYCSVDVCLSNVSHIYNEGERQSL